VVDESNDQLLSCSEDLTIRLWDLNTGLEIKQFKGHTNWVYSLCKVDKNLFVSGSADDSLKFWNITSGECVHTIDKAHSNSVMALLYSASNQVLISASSDNTIKVWDLKMGEAADKCTLKYTIENPFGQSCYSIAFLDGENDGTRVLVGDYSGNLLIVDLITGTCIYKVERASFSAINSLTIG